jgi:ATP-binding cassette, subfamily A (ABC1), member 3
MEECEALCNRIIIMVNGIICCIGSSQQLKNKYGKGFTVLIKVATGNIPRRLSRTNSQSPTTETAPNAWTMRQNSIVVNQTNLILSQNINEVKSFMSVSFANCELKAVHNNLLHFQINDEKVSWSKMFGLIERSKDRLKIEDYSIGQTTLEQIFLSFARKQRESAD